MSLPKQITFNGTTDTLSGWARRLGASKQALHVRLRAGWPLERALTVRVAKPVPTTLFFRGRSLTVSEWARETGLSVIVINNRLRDHWPTSRILTEPVHTRTGRAEQPS